MRITVSGRHMEITDDMRDHAYEKAEKLTRFFDGIKHIDVVLEPEGDGYKVEAVVAARGANTLVAHATAEDLMSALDQVVEKSERQLKKLKDKYQQKNRGKRQDRVVEAGVTADDLDDDDDLYDD
jgi:putative sigma-54 modulation protein